LPTLIALYEDHADQRDQFEAFAVHDQTVKSFAELDKKLSEIKKRHWQGKDLPFPVLLDASGKTEKLYGISAHPTGLLIDPEGKLVGEASAADLEAKLPPLPISRRWERCRDVNLNVFWSFEPSRNTLKQFARILKIQSRCEVELDQDALKASGLTPDSPLPGILFGGPVTLRSIEQLFLGPHGLGLAPSADEKRLVITRRPPTSEAESYSQKLRAKELTGQLNGARRAAEGTKTKPLEIKSQPLIDVIQLAVREFNVPVALDAKAMHAKIVDPSAKVSGMLNPAQLGKSLVKMVEPIGLTVEVRAEAVLLTSRTKY
jgi:hypothetical protein